MVNVSILLVKKTGELSALQCKDFDEAELYKKCGLKNLDHFGKQTEWSSKIDGLKYFISLYAKTEGRANSENKYDFPPPVDTKLFFGTCALVCKTKSEDGSSTICSLSIPLWNKIYEKLFGGFEDLAAGAEEDEEEEDELATVDKKKKTKQGYLKDGFVVDSSDAEDEDGEPYYGSDSDEDSVTRGQEEADNDEEDEIGDLDLAELINEIAEEDYDYSDLKPTEK